MRKHVPGPLFSLSIFRGPGDEAIKPSTTMTGNMDGIEANTGEMEDSDLLAGSESDTLVQRTFKDRKDKEAEQWASIRSTLLNAATEQSGMHFESLCSIFLKTPVNVRCQSCVSDTMFEPSTTMTGNMDGIEANTGEIEDSDLLAGSESDTLVQRTFKDRKDKEAQQWASIQSTLLNAATEQSGMHFESLCSICLKTPVNV